METNELLLNGMERERIKLKCNFHYVCSAPGLIQIVELVSFLCYDNFVCNLIFSFINFNYIEIFIFELI